MWPFKKSQTKQSSRKQIAIKEVRDGVLVLPNNEYRLVLETSSVNFELKSDQEQDVLIDGFQSFLNSLPSSLQILIRIRELDIEQYTQNINLLKATELEAHYHHQIDNYTYFINQLVTDNKILSRKFYIIIPYKPEANKSDFDLAKQQLNQTRDLVSKSLEKLGMKATTLNSLQVLNLFYTFYNQGQIKTQELNGQTIQTLLKENHV